MEASNQTFLCNALLHLGFGEKIQDELTLHMNKDAERFEIGYAASFDQVPIAARLFFMRTPPNTYYYFYKYRLQVEDRSHEFGIYKGWGVTLKEAYNLLCGRAVFKQSSRQEATLGKCWMQLDLHKKENEGYAITTWYEEYGFDIEKAVAALHIELPSSNWDMGMLYRSLERGNLQAVTMDKDGKKQRVCICANPKDRNILVLPDIKNPAVEPPAATDEIAHANGKKKSPCAGAVTK